MALPHSRFHARLGTFRQLEIFVKFAETGSISQTAEALHLAQPSVSIQLKKLSENLDIPLVETIGKKLYLTDAGTELYHASLEIFDTVFRLESRLASLSGMQAGLLKLAVVTTSKYFFPHILGPFCRLYPAIDVTFNIQKRGDIINRLRENLDDCYVFSFPPQDMDIETIRFLSNPLVVIAPIDHPLAKEKNIPFSRLEDENFIMREPGSGTRHAIERFLLETGYRITEKMTIESNEAVKHSVMAGLGISILSVHSLGYDGAQQYCILDVEGFPMRHHWYVVYLRNKKLSDISRTFLKFLQQEGTEITNNLLIGTPAEKYMNL